MVGNFVYDTDFHHHRPSSRPTSQSVDINNGSHHAWRLRSFTPRFNQRRPLGGMGCRYPRTYACRQRFPRALPDLCRAKLLETPGDPRVVPKPSCHHLPRTPKVYLFSAFMQRRLHDGSAYVCFMLSISTSFGRTEQDQRPDHGTSLRCSRPMCAS